MGRVLDVIFRITTCHFKDNGSVHISTSSRSIRNIRFSTMRVLTEYKYLAIV